MGETREARCWWFHCGKTSCVSKLARVLHIRSPLPLNASLFPGAASLPLSRQRHPTLPRPWTGPKTWLEADQKSLCLHTLHCQQPYKTVLKERRLKEAELCFPSQLVLRSPPGPSVRPTAGALDPRRRPQLPRTSSSSLNLSPPHTHPPNQKPGFYRSAAAAALEIIRS